MNNTMKYRHHMHIFNLFHNIFVGKYLYPTIIGRQIPKHKQSVNS